MQQNPRATHMPKNDSSDQTHMPVQLPYNCTTSLITHHGPITVQKHSDPLTTHTVINPSIDDTLISVRQYKQAKRSIVFTQRKESIAQEDDLIPIRAKLVPVETWQYNTYIIYKQNRKTKHKPRHANSADDKMYPQP